MFRDLARKKQQLSAEECTELLVTQTRGILSVIGDGGYPYGTPMNHFYSAEDGCIYFHCGRCGHRLDALRQSDKACFCVVEPGERAEGEWALNVRSVIVFGRVEIIDDTDLVIRITEQLCHKFTQDEAYIQHELEHFAKSTLLLRLIPAHICGKRVNES